MKIIKILTIDDDKIEYEVGEIWVKKSRVRASVRNADSALEAFVADLNEKNSASLTLGEDVVMGDVRLHVEKMHEVSPNDSILFRSALFWGLAELDIPSKSERIDVCR